MSKQGRESDKINGLIDKGCTLEGKLSFDGAVQINGDFRGEVESDGALVVGPDAHVNGRLTVGVLVVEGSVEGEVNASLRVELRRGGRIIANIKTNTLVIEEGAFFHGNCVMLTEDARTYDADSSGMQEGTDVSGESQDVEELIQ